MSKFLSPEPPIDKKEVNLPETLVSNQGTLSSVRQRNLEATRDHSSNSENKQTENKDSSLKQSRVKELDSFLSTLYQALLIFNFVQSGYVILFFLISKSPSLLISALLGSAQWFTAFNGLRKRDFGKMKNAFNFMKLYLIYQGFAVLIPLMRDGTEFEWPRNGYSDIKALYNDLLSFDFFSIIAILLTVRFRNILKTVGSNEKNEQIDPLAKLNSWRYTIYKYWLVIYFCWILKNLVEDVCEQKLLSHIRDVLALMASDIGFFIQVLSSIAFVIFNGLRIPFVFGAIRNKDLRKIRTAIKISILGFVLNSFFEICSDIIMLHEGRRPDGYLIVSFKFEIHIIWWLVLTRLLTSVGHYLLFIYGSYRIQSILTASEKKSS